MQSKESIRSWMVQYVSRLVGLAQGEIDTARSFDEFGLDSTAAAGMSGDLSDWLGIHLEANLTKEHRTIDAVADYVTSRLKAA